jgi:DNA polymerase III subunit gamma/tau
VRPEQAARPAPEPARREPASAQAAGGRPAPAGSAPETAPAQRPADGDSPQPASSPQAGNGRPATAPPSAGPAGGATDAAALRARWPEVLAAVQREGRVAWMQLSNASVQSYADNVLTLAFANAGMAKGFLNGGYDKHLSTVLQALFGITPHIATVLGSGGGNMASYTGTTASGPEPVRPPAEPRGRPSNGATAQSGGRASVAAPSTPAPAIAAEEDPDPSDEAAPVGLTGMGLIERELGGRVIQEIGEE